MLGMGWYPEVMAMTRNLEGFRDANGLRHLVCCWSPSLHIFFFFVGELTITLEDVVNNFLLPMFGNKGFFNIQLSVKDLAVEEQRFKYFVGLTASSGVN